MQHVSLGFLLLLKKSPTWTHSGICWEKRSNFKAYSLPFFLFVFLCFSSVCFADILLMLHWPFWKERQFHLMSCRSRWKQLLTWNQHSLNFPVLVVLHLRGLVFLNVLRILVYDISSSTGSDFSTMCYGIRQSKQKKTLECFNITFLWDSESIDEYKTYYSDTSVAMVRDSSSCLLIWWHSCIVKLIAYFDKLKNTKWKNLWLCLLWFLNIIFLFSCRMDISAARVLCHCAELLAFG